MLRKKKNDCDARIWKRSRSARKSVLKASSELEVEYISQVLLLYIMLFCVILDVYVNRKENKRDYMHMHIHT
jgi:hypothetical protein